MLAKVLLPAIALMTMPLGSIPAQSAQPKIKIGVTTGLFDDVWNEAAIGRTDGIKQVVKETYCGRR